MGLEEQQTIRSLLFLELQNSVLDLPLNRLAAILYLYLSGGVWGWVYRVESACFSSFSIVPGEI